MNTPIFLLHGLGANSWTMMPLKLYLVANGFENVFYIDYDPEDEFNTVLGNVSGLIQEKLDKHQLPIAEIILIGQSYGGLLSNNLHKLGWNIKLGIYIVSPLRGARFLSQLETIIPPAISNYLKKKSYEILMEEDEPFNIIPPHPYTTIGASWGPSSEYMFSFTFDGCVYEDETILEPDNHRGFSFWDHRTIFICPAMFVHVKNKMCEILL